MQEGGPEEGRQEKALTALGADLQDWGFGQRAQMTEPTAPTQTSAGVGEEQWGPGATEQDRARPLPESGLGAH